MIHLLYLYSNGTISVELKCVMSNVTLSKILKIQLLLFFVASLYSSVYPIRTVLSDDDARDGFCWERKNSKELSYKDHSAL